ncbi:MAG: metal-dependent transcriptional regulator [Synergistaceae bacterium]|nr:metal-dependent transcriptional regulator [Synergistaceae bacterium]
MKNNESEEMYLETILILHGKSNKVRSIDIAKELGFSKPTVSVALKKMREVGLLTVGEDGSVLLTESGSAVAEQIYERHNVLASMLMSVGVDEDTAFADACRMEHYISQKSFDCMKEHYLKYKGGC